MARTEAARGKHRRRPPETDAPNGNAPAVSAPAHDARVAKALRLLDRNCDRMDEARKDAAAWERTGKRNARIWRAIANLGIDGDVSALLRARWHARGRPTPA